LGWAQAAGHAQRLADISFARAYASPLGRARLTAERVLTGQMFAGRNVSLTLLDDLAELHWGELAGLLPAERAARFPELKAARDANKWNTPIPGGESYASARPRAARAAQQMIGDGPGNLLVVGHEMINRLLRMELLGLSQEDALWLSHPHDMVFRIEHGQESVLT
jgi:broad specificity phosphatase PhoE